MCFGVCSILVFCYRDYYYGQGLVVCLRFAFKYPMLGKRVQLRSIKQEPILVISFFITFFLILLQDGSKVLLQHSQEAKRYAEYGASAITSVVTISLAVDPFAWFACLCFCLLLCCVVVVVVMAFLLEMLRCS